MMAQSSNEYIDINEFAKQLRKDQTKAEEQLWQLLRNRKANGSKFRRQHTIGPFIVDFYCHEAGLAIEVDGGIHDNPGAQEHDRGREFELGQLGITVVRFSNKQVIDSSEEVIKIVLQFLNRKVI